jgi:hypothetical protein
MESKSNVKKPDRIILFEVGIIVALFFVNYVLNLSYKSHFVVNDDDERIWQDSTYRYIEPEQQRSKKELKPEKQVVSKAEYFNPTAIIIPISDLFKTIETVIMPSSALLPGKIGPIVIAPIVDSSTIVFTNAEVLPQFPGGPNALNRFIIDNFYIPQELYDYAKEVNLNMEFIIDNDGKVIDVKVISCSSPGVGAEREAKRVYNKMPTWSPGQSGGKAVKVRLTQPVKIKIEN